MSRCHGAYWCAHSLAHTMPIFLCLLQLNVSNSCLCVCSSVKALSSSSTFIYKSRHIHMYICVDYCEMTTHNCDRNIPITISLCVPADRGFVKWHTHHAHRKNVDFCVYLPFPYVRSSTSSLSVSIPSTRTNAHVCMFTLGLFKPNTKNICKQVNAKQNIYLCLHTCTDTMNIKQLKW